MKIISWNLYIPHDKSKEVEFDIIHGEPKSYCLSIIEDGDLYEGKISYESFMKNDYPKNKQFQFLIDNSTKRHICTKDCRPPIHYLMGKVQSTYHFCDENQTAYTHFAFGVFGKIWNEDMIKDMSKRIAYIKSGH